MNRVLPKLIFASLVLLTLSCKKSIENAKENAIVSAMTDGEWVLTSFTLDETDITSQFNPLRFKFYANNTVDAINTGAVVKSGTWQGDIGKMSISANFNGAENPLQYLNATWHIDNNSWTYVVASVDDSGHRKTMRLEKL
jgi:hypothetical protein